MSIELLLLSSRIALLVLVGSALAFALGWLWRAASLKKTIARLQTQLTTLQEDRQRLRNLLDHPAPPDVVKVGEAQMHELEVQCMNALQQRDEAERQAAAHLNRIRSLQEQMERLERESVPRTDYARLEEELRQQQLRPLPAAEPVAAKTPQPLPAAPVTTAGATPPTDFPAFPPAPAMAMKGLARPPAPVKRGPAPNLESARSIANALHAEAARTTDEAEKTRLARQIRAVEKAIQSAPAVADDLTRIKGIKKIQNNQLLAHGIASWQQIADWTDEDTAAFSELLVLGNRIVKEKWRAQAADLLPAPQKATT
jgi:predicted flap endonuclease-1-like 5' DNA nuclease/Asp-tRNA(Asn)/Glu-tRNA(Gln) amidotransferase C subunit